MASAACFVRSGLLEAAVRRGNEDAAVIKSGPYRLPIGSCQAVGTGGGASAAKGGSFNGSRARCNVAQSTALVEALETGGTDIPPPEATPIRPGWRQQQGNLASRWRDIAGENNWDGLLEPLDPDLQREILRNGDFIWPLYDAMDSDPASIFRGSCLYNPRKLLDKVKLRGTGYRVTKYLYMLSDVDFVNKFGAFFQFPTGEEKDEFWSKDSNWVGFVAVATDEDEIARLGRRDIIITFRGTNTAKEWVLNVFDFLLPTQIADDSVPWTDVVKVEAGFWKMFTGKDDKTRYNKKSVAEQVVEEIKRLIRKYDDGKGLSISIAGHSLGASIAVLTAYELARTGANKLPSASGAADETPPSPPQAAASPRRVWAKVWKDLVTTVRTLLPGVNAEKTPIPVGFLPGTVPITSYCFGSPRVGNDDFRDTLHALGVKVLRVENPSDIVPRFPGLVINEWHVTGADKWLSLFFDSFPWTYMHVGTRFEVDHKESPLLGEQPEFMAVHDIEVYLHLVDGYESQQVRFNPNVREKHRREFVLVNKYGSLIKDKRIPQLWFQVENKGIVYDSQGRWRPAHRQEEDMPINCFRVFDD